MPLKNLLIISQDFPPINTIGARRFGELSVYLEPHGYRPWIVTMKTEGNLKVPLPAEQIIEIGKNSRAGMNLGQWYSDRTLIHLLESWGFRPRSVGRQSASWAKQVLEQKSQILDCVKKIDGIIGTYTPLSSLWIASKLSKEFKAPWIADFRDLGAIKHDDRNFLIRQIDSVIEDRVLKSARAIITVSDTMKKLFTDEYKKKTEIVYHGFQVPSLELKNKQKPFDYPYIYYAGQLYKHQMPALELVMNQLKECPDLHFVLRLLGPRRLREKAAKLAHQLGLSSRIHILPNVEPDQVNYEAEHSIANFVLENLSQLDEWTKGTIPGKFMRLLPLDPPIIAVARSDSDIARLLTTTGRGILCSDSQNLKIGMDRARSNPQEFAVNSHKIQPFSTEVQAARLCRFLDEVLTQ